MAFEQAGKQAIDPAFYLGAVLHRVGRPQEALRYLGEANRIDAGCPFVTWQMGVSLVASNGDAGMAVRALQRALGPARPAVVESRAATGLGRGVPGRPVLRPPAGHEEPLSSVRYSAATSTPSFGRAIRPGPGPLPSGAFQEAADLFNKLLQDTAPTTALLRGLGLSLARLAALRPGVQAPARRPGTGATERPIHGRVSRPLWRDGPADAAGGQAEERGLGRAPAGPPVHTAGQRRVGRRPVHRPRRGAGAASRRCPSKTRRNSATYWRRCPPSMPSGRRPITNSPSRIPDAVKPVYAWLYHPRGHACTTSAASATSTCSRGPSAIRRQHREYFAPTPVEFRRRRIHLSEARRRRQTRPRFPKRSAPIIRPRARNSCWPGRGRRRRRGERTRRWNAWRCCCGWRRRAWRGTTGWPVCTIAAATWTGRPRCWPAGVASTRSIPGR